jgi:hypothetical protein
VALRPFAFAIRAEAVIGSGGALALPRSLIQHIGPDASGPGLAVPRRQHRDRRIIGMDHRRCHHMGADQIRQWGDPPGGVTDPVGQGGALDLDALASQNR